MGLAWVQILTPANATLRHHLPSSSLGRLLHRDIVICSLRSRPEDHCYYVDDPQRCSDAHPAATQPVVTLIFILSVERGVGGVSSVTEPSGTETEKLENSCSRREVPVFCLEAVVHHIRPWADINNQSLSPSTQARGWPWSYGSGSIH